MKKKPQLMSIVSLYVIFFLLLASCKKDSSDLDGQYSVQFSSNALAYVKLTPGKYLIYKDSATNDLDSVVVTTSSLTNRFIPKTETNLIVHPAHTIEEFRLILTKYSPVYIGEWFNGNAITESVYPFISVNNAAVTLRDVDNSLVFNLSDYNLPNLTMTVEGKVYNNVVEKISHNGLDINDSRYKKTAFYWAKGIGIIKRTTIRTGGTISTYTLLRNN